MFNLLEHVNGNIKQFEICENNTRTSSSSEMIWQNLCWLVEFPSDLINVSQWIEFIGLRKVFLVELNAWNCCPEHIIAIERIALDCDRFGNCVNYTSIGNNWRISHWLKNESHQHWAFSKGVYFKISFWNDWFIHAGGLLVTNCNYGGYGEMGKKSHRRRHVSSEVICMKNRDGSISKWLKISITCFLLRWLTFFSHLSFYEWKSEQSQ